MRRGNGGLIVDQTDGRWVTLQRCVVALFLGLALVGCSQKDMLDKMSSPEDRALAQTVIADLQSGPSQDADLASRIDATLRGKLSAALPQMRAAIPGGPGGQSRLVDAGFRVMNVNGQTSRSSYLAYEIDAGAKRSLVRMQIARQGSQAQITSLLLNELKAPVEELNSFSLAGKSASQYAVLALTILSFLTIIVSEVVLVRTKRIPLKWLWFIGCLFGYGQVSVDWSTGAVAFMPLYLQLLGAFALKAGMLAPWRVGFAIPIVSIVFLAMRRRLQKPEPKPATAFF